MMDALGVAGDFGADHARRVGLVFRAVHPADGLGIEKLHIKRADGGAVVRAGGMADCVFQGLIHGGSLSRRTAHV